MKAIGMTLLILLGFYSLPLQADVKLAKIFSDHMVLQQNLPLKIFGFASPNEKISVHFNQQKQSIEANSQGRWLVTFAPMNATVKPLTLTVKANNTIQLKDVLIGEVWIAAGQSNMSRGLRYVKPRITKEKMDTPNLRLFQIEPTLVPQKTEVKGVKGWAYATHESMNKIFVHPRVGPYEFSEVAYEFANKIASDLKVPTGVISTAYGGTTAKEWTPHPRSLQHFKFDGKNERGHGALYQSMLQGIAPFTIRGVIWYQGENDGRNMNYHKDLKELIDSWRNAFKRSDMPFYMTQISQTTFAGGMLNVYDAQSYIANRISHTALAPSNDLWPKPYPSKGKMPYPVQNWLFAGGSNPHPPNKHIVAHRLADIALSQTYKTREAESLPPMYFSHEIIGNKIYIKFKNVGLGLMTDNNLPPEWFQYALPLKGDNVPTSKKQYLKQLQSYKLPAITTIKGEDTVVLELQDHSTVPIWIGFAQHPLARHNLYNSEKLPAIPFKIWIDLPKP